MIGLSLIKIHFRKEQLLYILLLMHFSSMFWHQTVIFHVFLVFPGNGSGINEHRPWDPHRCVSSLRLLTLIRASCLNRNRVRGRSHRIQKKKSIWEKQNYYMLVLTNLFGRCRPSLLWPKWLWSVNTAAKTYKLSGSTLCICYGVLPQAPVYATQLRK